MLKQYFIDDCSIVLNQGSLQILNPLATIIVRAHLQGVPHQQIASELASGLDIELPALNTEVRNTIEQVNHLDRPHFNIPPNPADRTYKPDREIKTSVEFRAQLSGIDFVIKSETPDIRAHLTGLLAESTQAGDNQANCVIEIFQESTNGKHYYPVVIDGATSDIGINASDAAIKTLYGAWGMAINAQDWLVLAHAGAVSKNGEGALFPAQGGSGKSTLVAYLMAQGYSLLADDCVPVLQDGFKLQPVPRCISVKTGSWPVLEPLFPALKLSRIYGHSEREMKFLLPDLNSIETELVNCRTLIVPSFSRSTTRTTVTPIERTEALDILLNGDSKIESPLTPQTASKLATWVQSLNCYSLNYAKLAEAHQEIDKLLAP